jgi:uncharacterized membrane protein SpoIIM required for sporulation
MNPILPSPTGSRIYKVAGRSLTVVLESLTNPFQAERRPVMLLLWGIVYALVGGLLADWLFPGAMASMVMVALVAIAAIPLMYNTIRFEEKKDLVIRAETKLLEEHGKAVMVFMMLFIGMTIGMTLLYVILPAPQAGKLFADQIETYTSINPHRSITGQVTGYATGEGVFQRIFLNNIKVLAFCVVFSLLYGAGAMFVLSWNASVIALAMGNVIRTNIAALAGEGTVGSYLKIAAIDGFSRYFIHGFFEIAAYVIAALAGGIISVAIIKKHFTTDKAEHIILDVSDLLLASFVVLLFSAVIEVYITPALF